MNGWRELIRVENVVKRFGTTIAADHVSLSIGEGEFFALLGPSGCGKTTLLRMLAGFETPDSGAILLDGKDLTNVKPWKRPVNMMFQSYALFPHMTVYDNIAYGLRQEGLAAAEIERRVRQVLELIGLPELAKRKPGNLSGGQRQRVALARAIVKQPRVLLLDEPLAALDRKLRVEMRLELKRLQNEVGIAFVFVTHDQEEALSMADRAAVMRSGKIMQVGTPEELYNTPANLYVAQFIGEANVFAGRLQNSQGEWRLVTNANAYRVPSTEVQRSGLTNGEDAAVVVRPERMVIEPCEGEQDSAPLNRVFGRLLEIAYLGNARNFVVETDDGQRLSIQTPATELAPPVCVGESVCVGWKVESGILVSASENGGGKADEQA
ncbi:MAG: polyamine ABC transporter ATP-binding protein [Anaerolineae bacterium]|jgi:spermidine/putrescine ABC transporter ATP-binding subunit|nr:MAG: polyamine ABC transporter ATP-binding protein [Anaerolineae bacterium]